MKNIVKNYSKNNKGITLIALVITIIVLLILAGISITMLSGDNGILNKSVQAKEATRGGEVKEKVTLAASNNTSVDYIGGTKQTRAEVIAQLHADEKLTDSEVAALEENDIITIGGITIDFSILGSSSTAKTLVQAFKDGEINVGDYITNYNSTLKNSSASVTVNEEKTGYSGTQQYQVDTNTTWRVLGLDETETKLMITTGSPIKKVMKSTGEDWEKDPYLYIDGAEGWYWAGEVTSGNVLDEICAIYDSRFADSTKSMRIEDINTALGLTMDRANNKIYKTNDQSQTAISTYQGFFGQSYTYKNGDFAPENYLKEKYPSNSAYTLLTSKKSGDSVAVSSFAYTSPENSNLNEVLFRGTGSDSSYAKSYWLASSGGFLENDRDCYDFSVCSVAGESINSMVFLFETTGNHIEDHLAVRPVVYLQPGVTVEDLTLTSSGSEENWTTSVNSLSASGRLLGSPYYGVIREETQENPNPK